MKSKTKKGDIYGNLTVLSEPFIKKQGNTSRFFVDVICTCGTKKTFSCSKLRSGECKQCSNCSFKQRSEKAKKISQYEQMFRRLVLDRSKKHDIDITLTVDDYTRIISQNCFYCNDAPRLTKRFSMRKYVNTTPVFANGIDRIDSSLGYTLDNCIPCCTSCNYAKHKLTQKEFFEKIRKIYKNLNL